MKFKSFGYLLSLLIFFSLGYLTAQKQLFPTVPQVATTTNTAATTDLNFALFNKAYALLKEHYLEAGQLEGTKLVNGAIRGMLSSLEDPYTAFFNENENQEFKEDLAGVYEGIGAQLGFKSHSLVIVAPLAGSPAQRSGVKAGDAILKIDEKETAGVSLPEAVDLIRGKAGSSVVLTLARAGASEPLEISVQREKIIVDSILVDWIGEEGQLAHLKVLRFGDDTKATWDRIVEDISRINPAGLILDLRNNPGGYLEAAVYLASDFFQDGVVVIKEEAGKDSKLEAGKKRQEFGVDHKARLAQIPVVVLINEGSASASEILAGALKVRQRAKKLIGQKTFGKGTVQEAFELGQGTGVHITTARWLLPNGETINGEGIIPDVEVENSEEDIKAGKDTQLDKAIEILEDRG